MILDRIKQYIDHKGISVAAFERSIGMSNASFGKSLKNGGAIGSDKLENILNIYPDLSPTWLMTGMGEMIISTTPKISEPHLVSHDGSDITLRLLSRIEQQAEEIGRLKERNAQLEKEKIQLELDLSRGIPPQEAARVFTHTPEPQKV